jgi:predicted dinucleotide-binding enzyme
VGNTDSLGEQLQRALPDVRVVKALNTVSSALLVDPGSLSEATDLFICGNDGAAKETVTELLVELGWHAERVRDLGDITSARGTEAYLALWTRVMSSLGTATFNVRVVVA